MSGTSILDADMATVGRWLRAGLDWWFDELRAMVPAALHGAGARVSRRLVWSAHSGFLIEDRDGRHIVPTGAPPMPLLLSREQCLVREVELPMLSGRDLDRLIALDADRLLPMPVERMLFVHRREGPVEGAHPPRQKVSICAFPREQAALLFDQAGKQAIAIASLGLAGDDGAHIGHDLTPAARAGGFMPRTRNLAAICWAILGFMLMLNIGLLIWRDVQSVARMRDLVAQQAPAVTAARTISRRIQGTQGAAVTLARRRAEQDAGRILGLVTRALPEKAWVQRYNWDGRRVRLSGYRRVDADVIGALSKVPQFADVRVASGEVGAEIPSGQPFDITFVVRESAP